MSHRSTTTRSTGSPPSCAGGYRPSRSRRSTASGPPDARRPGRRSLSGAFAGVDERGAIRADPGDIDGEPPAAPRVTRIADDHRSPPVRLVLDRGERESEEL